VLAFGLTVLVVAFSALLAWLGPIEVQVVVIGMVIMLAILVAAI
jgi:hypothetical protein